MIDLKQLKNIVSDNGALCVHQAYKLPNESCYLVRVLMPLKLLHNGFTASMIDEFSFAVNPLAEKFGNDTLDISVGFYHIKGFQDFLSDKQVYVSYCLDVENDYTVDTLKAHVSEFYSALCKQYDSFLLKLGEEKCSANIRSYKELKKFIQAWLVCKAETTICSINSFSYSKMDCCLTVNGYFDLLIGIDKVPTKDQLKELYKCFLYCENTLNCNSNQVILKLPFRRLVSDLIDGKYTKVDNGLLFYSDIAMQVDYHNLYAQKLLLNVVKEVLK